MKRCSSRSSLHSSGSTVNHVMLFSLFGIINVDLTVKKKLGDWREIFDNFPNNRYLKNKAIDFFMSSQLRELYLAIRKAVYFDLFEEPIGQLLLKNKRIQLLVFDQHQEEIVQWIP
jgi:hypothetical protein